MDKKHKKKNVPEIERYRIYESLKRLIARRPLSPREYERMIKRLADALEV